MSDLNLQMILENIQEMKEEQLDKINAEFQKAAENQKEKELPEIEACGCRKCGVVLKCEHKEGEPHISGLCGWCSV